MNEAPLRIVIVGEFDPGLPSHRATNDALNHAADYLSVVVEHSWLPSSALAENRSADALQGCEGLWAAPGRSLSEHRWRFQCHSFGARARLALFRHLKRLPIYSVRVCSRCFRNKRCSSPRDHA